VRLYWLFLLINVFLLSAVAVSVFDILSKFVDHPQAVITLLATSLPKQATYFTNYMVLQGYAGYPLFWLLRVDELLICKLRHILVTKSKLEYREAEEPVPFFYALLYGRELLVFTIALTYCSMTPFMLPFAAFYFAIAYLVAKYNVLNVYPTHHEGMRMTSVVMDRVIVAVLLYQVIMLGVFSLKFFFPGTGVLVAIAITLWIWYYLNRVTYKPLKHVALFDLSKKKLNTRNQKHMDLVAKTYKHPALKPLKKPEAAESFILKNENHSEESEESDKDIEEGKEPGTVPLEEEEQDTLATSVHLEDLGTMGEIEEKLLEI